MRFATFVTAAIVANLFIRTNMHDMWATWWPHEYCKQVDAKKIECWGAAPNGSTVSFNAGGSVCYIDFAKNGGTWHLRGTRGHCEARVSGNSFIVR